MERYKSEKFSNETQRQVRKRETGCVKMNNAVILPLVRCGASEVPLETPRFLPFPYRSTKKKDAIRINLKRGNVVF